MESEGGPLVAKGKDLFLGHCVVKGKDCGDDGDIFAINVELVCLLGNVGLEQPGFEEQDSTEIRSRIERPICKSMANVSDQRRE